MLCNCKIESGGVIGQRHPVKQENKESRAYIYIESASHKAMKSERDKARGGRGGGHLLLHPLSHSPGLNDPLAKGANLRGKHWHRA